MLRTFLYSLVITSSLLQGCHCISGRNYHDPCDVPVCDQNTCGHGVCAECYYRIIDHFADHEGAWECCYTPGWDLTRLCEPDHTYAWQGSRLVAKKYRAEPFKRYPEGYPYLYPARTWPLTTVGYSESYPVPRSFLHPQVPQLPPTETYREPESATIQPELLQDNNVQTPGKLFLPVAPTPEK